MSCLRPLYIVSGCRTPVMTARQYHATRLCQLPYKDDQDRNSVKPRSMENTQSGTDADVAVHSDAAFNPDKTDPGHAKDTAQKNGNPLEVSGANPHVSKPQRETPDKSVSSTSGKQKKSQWGSLTKSGS